jgi:hypothetical protein
VGVVRVYVYVCESGVYGFFHGFEFCTCLHVLVFVAAALPLPFSNSQVLRACLFIHVPF